MSFIIICLHTLEFAYSTYNISLYRLYFYLHVTPEHFIKQDRNGSFAAELPDGIAEIRSFVGNICSGVF